MSDNLSEPEIFRIASILSQDTGAVKKKRQIYGSLGLPAAELEELKAKCYLDNSGPFGFFSHVLSNYKSINGSKATVKSLITRFTELNLGSVVDEILGKGTQTQDAIWFEVGFVVETFTGREDELQKLHERVIENTNEPITVINQVSAIVGLGGIGKSTLARKYAKQYSEYFNGNVIWVNSETKVSYRESLTRLHQRLFSTTKLKSDTDEELMQMVYDYFSTRKKKCLIIFDNVEDFDVLKLLPKHLTVQNAIIPYVLITSRITKWRPGVSVFELNVLTVDEAIKLLENSTRAEQNVKYEDLEKLAKALQCLPLALQQAAAYIEAALCEHSSPIMKYLELFKNSDKCRALLNYMNEDLSEHEKTTLYTWAITLENIEKKEYGPLAIQIMNISSFLRPDNIPSTIFVGGNLSDSISDPGRFNQDTFNDDAGKGVSCKHVDWREDDVNAAIILLKTYSMVSGSLGVIKVHRLVQRVVQLKLKIENNTISVLEQGLGLIQLAGNKQGRTYSDSSYLHADLIWRHALNHDRLIRKYADIVFMLCETVIPGYSHDILGTSINHILRVFGPAHENSIWTLYYGANVLFDRFDLYSTSKSLKILEKISPLATAELGITHNLTERIYELTFFNLNKKEKHEEALKVAEKLEVLRLSKYGSEHEKTLNILLYRVILLYMFGRADEAQGLIRRLNEVMKRVKYVPGDEYYVLRAVHKIIVILIGKRESDKIMKVLLTAKQMWTIVKGTNYESTLFAISHLAGALKNKGELDAALELFRTGVEVLSRVKGAEDEGTLWATKELAVALMKKGDLNEALELFRTAVEVLSRVKGAEDEWTLYAMKNLADALMTEGELHERVELLRTLLERWTSVKGAEHEMTLRATKDLADALMAEGELHETVELLRTAVEVRSRVKGAEVESTLRAMKDLANALMKEGELEEAVELFRTLVERWTREKGTGDKWTLWAMDDLADALMKKGELEEAVELLRTLVERWTRVKGIGDQWTLRATKDLADALMKKGELEEAVELFRTLVERWTRVKGIGDQWTLRATKDLADALMKKGELEEAVELFRTLVARWTRVNGAEDERTQYATKDLADALMKTKK